MCQSCERSEARLTLRKVGLNPDEVTLGPAEVIPLPPPTTWISPEGVRCALDTPEKQAAVYVDEGVPVDAEELRHPAHAPYLDALIIRLDAFACSTAPDGGLEVQQRLAAPCHCVDCEED